MPGTKLKEAHYLLTDFTDLFSSVSCDFVDRFFALGKTIHENTRKAWEMKLFLFSIMNERSTFLVASPGFSVLQRS